MAWALTLHHESHSLWSVKCGYSTKRNYAPFIPIHSTYLQVKQIDIAFLFNCIHSLENVSRYTATNFQRQVVTRCHLTNSHRVNIALGDYESSQWRGRLSWSFLHVNRHGRQFSSALFKRGNARIHNTVPKRERQLPQRTIAIAQLSSWAIPHFWC